MSESFISHPSCKKCEEKTYLGVYRYIDELFQISQCDKCHHYYSRSKLDDKNDIRMEMEKAIEILEDRISCPLCEEYSEHKKRAKKKKLLKDNSGDDFKYKYVISKGNSYRFYCRNHPLKKHNRYEFNNSPDHKKMTLRDFFEEIDIYDEVKKCELNEISVLTFLLTINMPKTIIAKLLNKSRPTLDNLIKSNNSTLDIESEYKKIINISDGGRKDLFETLINIPIETLDDTENFVKIQGEKILFNP